MSLEQKIVYAGLTRMTKDRTVVQNAFQYWQTNLEKNTFDIIEVTSKLVSYLGLDSKEKKILMIAMHAASNKAEIDLVDVPEYVIARGVQPDSLGEESEPEVQDSGTAHFNITKGYVKLLVEAMRRKGAAAYDEVDEILKDEGIKGVSSELFSLIKEKGFTGEALYKSIGELECRELAHELYLLIIDVIGPVEADIIVNGVIDKLLVSSDADRFDPRTLI